MEKFNSTPYAVNNGAVKYGEAQAFRYLLGCVLVIGAVYFLCKLKREISDIENSSPCPLASSREFALRDRAAGVFFVVRIPAFLVQDFGDASNKSIRGQSGIPLQIRGCEYVSVCRDARSTRAGNARHFA
jgi:hypothetical protein